MPDLSSPPPHQGAHPRALAHRFAEVRAASVRLAAPLSSADAQVQSMPDASPTKWHLAHTTWFFETFVLEPFEPGFKPHDPSFRVLFNSYYQGVGAQHPRPQRGLITRPGLVEVLAWREAVDARLGALLAGIENVPGEAAVRVELGLQHEQQHQELILTDLKHLLACNPTDPVYLGAPAAPAARPARGRAAEANWCEFDGGRVEIGRDPRAPGFGFDNESPRHALLLRPYALADRLVTQGEWLAFIDDGGYADPRWWLAAGWDWLQAQAIAAPGYWRHDADRGWSAFTLHGRTPIDPQAPVTHVSYYEADAYARWRGARDGLALRLPTEAEWEHAAQAAGPAALGAACGFVERGLLQPQPAEAGRRGALRQMFGEAWQWTASAYLPYPGFRPWAGAVGEYNGKFMVDQMVLRGASCVTPRSHARVSYRNFFPAGARWQFSGLRLARDPD